MKTDCETTSSEAVLKDFELPEMILRNNQVRRVVVMIGSGREEPSSAKYNDPAFSVASDIARSTANRPAEERLWICSGGKAGIMRAISAGTMHGGGQALGFGFQLPNKPTNGSQPSNTTHLFRYPGVRNHWFFRHMVALIAFPGGLGTFTELFDALLHRQLALCGPAPIFLYDSKFWRSRLCLEDLVKDQLVSADEIADVNYVDSRQSIIDEMRRRTLL
jgi:predicted Rossmann-fold nucleotide-binding protein